jgi:hypothetical protein
VVNSESSNGQVSALYSGDAMAMSRVSEPRERPSVEGIGFFATASRMPRTIAMPSSTVPWNGQLAAGMHAAR